MRHYKHYRRLTAFASLWLMLVVLLAGMPGNLTLAAMEEEQVGQAADPDLQREKEAHPHLSSNLRDLVNASEQGQAGIAAQDPNIRLEGNQVWIMLIMLDEASADAAVQALPTLGGRVTAHYKTWIDAWVPIDQLAQVEQLPGISLVRTPIWTEPIAEPEARAATTDAAEEEAVEQPFSAPEEGAITPQAGSVTSGGVEKSNADVWHRGNYRGNGIRVAIIENDGSGGFKDYQRSQGTGDLPAQITLYRNPNDPNDPVSMASNHGTMSAEVVYDLAPNAQFFFASPATGTELAQTIVGLARDQGVDVFSASLSLSGFSPGDGTGVVADAIAQAFHTYDALYVQSAGNQAEGHWDGFFTDSNNDGLHEFVPGDTTNLVCTSSVVFLRWNDWPGSRNDFDFQMVRENSDGTVTVVAQSTNPQTGTQPPVEFVMPPSQGCYGLRVKARNIDRSRSYVLNISTFDKELEHQVEPRSLLETATSEETIAVAAVDGSSDTREFYSSVGPTHGPGGSRLSGKAQPRIAGFAFQPTTFGDYGGTSGAAPHVAGGAVLMMQRYNRDAPFVKSLLESHAVDKGTTGYDSEYGFGVLQLRSPCDAADTDEPNDDPTFKSGRPRSEITPLQVNDFALGPRICPAEDVDWYWFDATPGIEHIVSITNRANSSLGNVQLRFEVKQIGPTPIDTRIVNPGQTGQIRFTPPAAGLYMVGVTDVNGVGASNYRYDVWVRTRATPALLPVDEGFEGTTFLRPHFTVRTLGSGRVRVSPDHSPPFGSHHLLLDSSISNHGLSAAEVTLHVNPTGFRTLTLGFRHREFNDEDNGLADQYSISDPEGPNPAMTLGDGIAMSVDGGRTWHKIYSLTGSNSTNVYQQKFLFLSDIAAQKGLTIGNDLRIRFHHHEKPSAYPIPTDGFAFDNIGVGGVPTTSISSAALDFNVDGISDMVCRNPLTGNNAIWTLNGETTLSQAQFDPVTKTATLAGAGDVDGDGITDLVWRDSISHTVELWQMQGRVISATTMLGAIEPDWELVNLADFNGDARADYLWHHPDTGATTLWLHTTGMLTREVRLPTVGNGAWRLVASTDTDGDGQADLLWRNIQTGENALWRLDGETVTRTALPTVADLTWRIVGVADFDGDGKDDITWRNRSTGGNTLWLMDGETLRQQVNLEAVTNPDGRYRIVGTADYDGNGGADLLWRDVVSGTVRTWLLDSTTFSVTTNADLGIMPPQWDVEALPVRDYDGQASAPVTPIAGAPTEMQIGAPVSGPATTPATDNLDNGMQVGAPVSGPAVTPVAAPREQPEEEPAADPALLYLPMLHR